MELKITFPLSPQSIFVIKKINKKFKKEEEEKESQINYAFDP